jgi:hypothetical protein
MTASVQIGPGVQVGPGVQIGLALPLVSHPQKGPPAGSLGSVSKSPARDAQAREMTWPEKRRFEAKLQATIRGLGPRLRASSCLTLARWGLKQGERPRVQVLDGERARWDRLHRCADRWACPRCAPVIAEHRRGDLATALGRWREQGGGFLLVTLTHSHGGADRLGRTPDPSAPVDPDMLELWEQDRARRAGKLRARRARGRALWPADDAWLRAYHRDMGMVAQQAEAIGWMSASKRFKGIRKAYGVAHRVRAPEATWSPENGWHPHHHAVWLTVRPLSEGARESLRAELFALWRDACARFDLGAPSSAHGVDVAQGYESAGDYVSKWGMAEELTMGRLKVGKLGSLSPWGLLLRAHQGDVAAGRLWLEFLGAYRGRAQLYWSPGMRKALGISDEISDEDALARVAQRDAVTHEVQVLPHELAAVFQLGFRDKVLELAEGLCGAGLDRERVELGIRTMLRQSWAVLAEWQDGRECAYSVDAEREAGREDVTYLRALTRRMHAALDRGERKELRREVIRRTEAALC